MAVWERMNQFASRFGKKVVLNNVTWRYYSLGAGAPIFWLTGGLRRAALGFAFLERLAANHTVIAPDYAPVLTIQEFMQAFDVILETEGVNTFVLGSQSYGGMLAQAYLAHKGESVERLILSSAGPADYGRIWLPAVYAMIALARLLPEQTIKKQLTNRLLRIVSLPAAERGEWQRVIHSAMQNDITRADVISHFAVAADLISNRIVTAGAYRDWKGRIIVLSAEDDPTQSQKDIPRYEKLFGRSVQLIKMKGMGHADLLFNPEKYLGLFEQALI